MALALIDNLVGRGLDPTVRRLFIIDGAKALSKAIRRTFGRDAAIQRCQIHKTPAEPARPRLWRPCRRRPRVNANRRPQRVRNIEADTGLQHPLSTLHERRRRRPCKTRFRLEGCASTGRGSNPLDRFERFQVT